VFDFFIFIFISSTKWDSDSEGNRGAEWRTRCLDRTNRLNDRPPWQTRVRRIRAESRKGKEKRKKFGTRVAKS